MLSICLLAKATSLAASSISLEKSVQRPTTATHLTPSTERGVGQSLQLLCGVFLPCQISTGCIYHKAEH